jgi:hypothetical protein
MPRGELIQRLRVVRGGRERPAAHGGVEREERETARHAIRSALTVLSLMTPHAGCPIPWQCPGRVWLPQVRHLGLDEQHTGLMEHGTQPLQRGEPPIAKGHADT